MSAVSKSLSIFHVSSFFFHHEKYRFFETSFIYSSFYLYINYYRLQINWDVRKKTLFRIFMLINFQNLQPWLLRLMSCPTVITTKYQTLQTKTSLFFTTAFYQTLSYQNSVHINSSFSLHFFCIWFKFRLALVVHYLSSRFSSNDDE